MAEPSTVAALVATPALPAGETPLAAGTSLRVLPPRALVRLQLPRRAIPEAGALRIGDTPLPTSPGTCVGDDPAVLWLAPDGWLLISERHDAGTLVAAARRACGERTAAVVDVSDALVGFELEGPRVRDLLSRGTGLELAERALAPGRCTRTRLAQLAVIVRPHAPERVELFVDRGPAAWLRDWFIDAGRLL